MLTRLTMPISLQYIQILNPYVVNLKLIYKSIIAEQKIMKKIKPFAGKFLIIFRFFFFLIVTSQTKEPERDMGYLKTYVVLLFGLWLDYVRLKYWELV